MDEYTKFIEELKMKADLTDVVNKYTPVMRRGSNYFAVCPLHADKGPSFCIYPNSNSYYCFGCHAAGDVIKFVEEIERVDFKEAVEILAKKYNMEVPQFKGDKSLQGEKKKRDRIYALTRDAALHYYQNLMGPKGAKAREYLKGRGLSQETITKFGLGYAIDKYDLPKFLKEKGYTYDEMVEAKVAFKTANGSVYDPQYERFITPIMNRTKNVIAFGGRVLVKPQDGIAKYYNSVFNKSTELFGQHIVKTLRNLNDVVLVEGYMDVISLYQAGIPNALASMGTALTPGQAHVIKNFAKKVYFMYDGDEAGQNGMLRGVDILKNEGLDVKVVVLDVEKEAKDADEFIQKFGAKAMRDKIYSTAIPMYEYKILNVLKNYNLKSPEERGEFAKAAVECIKDIPTRAQAEPLINYIQAKSGVSQQSLFDMFNAMKSGQEVKVATPQTKLQNDNYTRALRFIVFAAYGGVDGVSVKDEYADCFKNKELQELYDNFRVNQGELTTEDLEEIRDTNPEANAVLLAGAAIGEDVAKKNYYACRKFVLLSSLEEKLKLLNVQLEETKDEQVINDLLIQIAQTTNYIRNIKQGKLEV